MSIRVIMVASLLQEVEEIWAWNELEKEKKEAGSLEGTMKGDDVGMWRKRLMDGDLGLMVREREQRRGEGNGPRTFVQQARRRQGWLWRDT